MRMSVTHQNNEKGQILIAALLVLMILTVFGISATTTTSIELKISALDRFRKVAFYNADSGVYVIPKVISACIDDSEEISVGTGSSAPGITFLPDDGSYVSNTFYDQIMGYDSYDNGSLDVKFTPLDYDVNVDVRRDRSETLAGGGAEFGAGAEGVGVGSTGGVGIYYEMDSIGRGPLSASSNVGAVYRKVPGVPGGL